MARPHNWGTGARERTHTSQHQKQRARVLKRDSYQCQLRRPGCIGLANEMDHKVNVKAGGSDDDDNMQGVCHPCHQRKTNEEAQAALAAKRARLKLPAAKHPGLLNS